MGAKKRECVVVRCDNGCGRELMSFEDEYTVHFPDEATAAKDADDYGWRKVGDEWGCPTCPASEKAADILEAAGVEP